MPTTLISKSQEHVEVFLSLNFCGPGCTPGGTPVFCHLNVQLILWGFQNLREVYNCSNQLQFQVLLNLQDLTRNMGYLTGLETPALGATRPVQEGSTKRI